MREEPTLKQIGFGSDKQRKQSSFEQLVYMTLYSVKTWLISFSALYNDIG